MLKTLLSAAAAIAMTGSLFAGNQAWSADAPTPLEKRFSELAKLPAVERTTQMVEAAKKEGKLVMLPILQSKLGRDHTQMFEKRYPFLKVEYLDIGSEDMAERFVIEESSGRHLDRPPLGGPG